MSRERRLDFLTEGCLSREVEKRTSITKSILGLWTFAKASALTMHSLSLWLFSGSFFNICTSVYSPRGPTFIMVSATVYLFTVPSFNSLESTGMHVWATYSPNYATAVHAAARTFQYWSLRARAKMRLALTPVAEEASLPMDQTHMALTLGSSSCWDKFFMTWSTQYSASGSPIVPIDAAITSLTWALSSFCSCKVRILMRVSEMLRF